MSTSLHNPSTEQWPPHHWIGRCAQGTTVQGLFDPSLQCRVTQSSSAPRDGDIVLVRTKSASSKDNDNDEKATGENMAGAEAQLTVIATGGSAKATVYRILQQQGLNPIHAPEVEKAAQTFLPFKPDLYDDLADLQHLPFVTIDNEDSKDLDQALYVSSDTEGRYTVYYALADASWFVKPDTPLFNEALSRGVTYYAPDLAVTMLPALLSENLISLNPDVTRRAIVFKIKMNPDGSARHTDVYRALIKSRAKLSYTGVQSFYDTLDNAAGDSEHDGEHDATQSAVAENDWNESLKALRAVGHLRMAQAELRDVVNFNRRESRVHIDPANPDQFLISVRERLNSELYNEQISLLCNIEGARLLQSLNRLSPELHAIYRVHLPPLKSRMHDFKKKLAAIIHARQLDSQWHWTDGTSLANYIEGLPGDPADARIRQAIEQLVMMTNRASGYAAEPDIHYALSVDAYARFSSPMREMVGVFTHKELMEALEFEPSWSREEDQAVRAQIIESANLAKSRQRKLEKAFQLEALQCFLKQDLNLPESDRPGRAATVTGMRGNRVYVHVDGFAMDIKIYLDDLGERCGCRYTVDDVSARPTVEGQPVFIIGDGVRVTTQRWCAQKNRYLFNIASL